MDTWIIALAAGGVMLIGFGLWREWRGPRSTAAQPGSAASSGVIQPLTPPRQTVQGGARPTRAMRPVRLFARVPTVAAQHPAPPLAVLETGFWLLMLLTLVLHLRDTREGMVAFAVWAVTIGPHEIGHVVCMPFGWFLHVLGGSLWQILAFALPAIYAYAVRRQITTSLLFWAMAGHSFINLAPYIGDARARELPLIFGLSKDHHDWWNLLRTYGLLDYDHALAALATITGAAIVTGAAALGILAAWVLPRPGVGPRTRFTGGFWRALRARLEEPR